MSFLPALFALTVFVAGMTKVVLAQSWRARVKLLVLTASLVPLPVFAWWMAFNSLGSGWGFGLIATLLSVIIGLGAIVGWIWHSLSRRA